MTLWPLFLAILILSIQFKALTVPLINKLSSEIGERSRRSLDVSKPRTNKQKNWKWMGWNWKPRNHLAIWLSAGHRDMRGNKNVLLLCKNIFVACFYSLVCALAETAGEYKNTLNNFKKNQKKKKEKQLYIISGTSWPFTIRSAGVGCLVSCRKNLFGHCWCRVEWGWGCVYVRNVLSRFIFMRFFFVFVQDEKQDRPEMACGYLNGFR